MGDQIREGSENLTGGEVTSLPPHLIGQGEFASSQNLDPRNLRGAATRNGRSIFGVSGGSNTGTKGLKAWTRDLGTEYLFLRLGTTFYNASAASVASIGIGGTNDERFRAGALNNIMVFAVDGRTPAQYDGTTFSDVTGSPPAEAKYAAVHVSKLWLAGNDANPQTKYFSATNNPNDYTAANDAGSITTQDGGGDTIRGLVANKYALLTLYRNYVDVLEGDSVANFRERRLIDRGLVSLTGYVSAGEVCFFASDDAIYMVAGTKVSDLTTLKFRETYNNISDKSQITLGIKGDLLLVEDYGANVTYACAYKYNRWATWTSVGWEVMDTANDQTLYAGTDSGSTQQVWKLDTGSLDNTATITANFRIGNYGFGAPDAIKNLGAIRVHAKPGCPTITLTYYKNGSAVGSTNTVTFPTTADHDWSGAMGQSKLRGYYLGFKAEWVGQGTVYGWALYAEVVTVKGQIPQLEG